MNTIGFIGGGNMAEALIKGIIAAKLYNPQNITVSDIQQKCLDFLAEQYGVHTISDNAALVAKTDIVVLSVKPQNMTDVLKGIKTKIKNGQLFISIAAGKRIDNITNELGNIPVLRVMPNTPALVGQGASAIFANEMAKPMLETAKTIFSAVGKVVTVENEDLLDAVTALSGSGPAYYFLLMEEMIKAGIELGLPADVAKDLTLQTAKGAAILALEADKQNESPAELRKKVTSPGGTTEAALKVFAENSFGQLISSALQKATQRSRELSKNS